jgi:two-component system phosphate regulon sensor histidine kinase PhoR
MRNTNRLVQLTNDLMEITKLETGELKSTPSPFSIGQLISEVIENLQYKAETSQIKLFAEEIDPKLVVWADRNQIRQVLTNLVDNGLKYNQAGGDVSVKVRIYPRNPELFEILVRDTGFGIEQKHIPRVTERFYRVDKSRSRDKGGTGLGLSIVKHILESHGEQLHIASTVGSGSTFSFTLKNYAYNQ